MPLLLLIVGDDYGNHKDQSGLEGDDPVFYQR